MNIDWTITIAVFLLFVAWSFTFYSSLVTTSSQPLGIIADDVENRILKFLTIDSYEVLIRVNSSVQASNAVLFFNFTWPDETKNATRIYSGNTLLGCTITGNTVYWRSDLVNASLNYFTMTFSNRTAAMNCSASFAIVNETQAIPWAMEKRRLLSQNRTDTMNSTEYNIFRESLGITNEFRIEINTTGNITAYGQTLPVVRNVFVRESWTKVEEDNQEAKMSIMVW